MAIFLITNCNTNFALQIFVLSLLFERETFMPSSLREISVYYKM